MFKSMKKDKEKKKNERNLVQIYKYIKKKNFNLIKTKIKLYKNDFYLLIINLIYINIKCIFIKFFIKLFKSFN